MSLAVSPNPTGDRIVRHSEYYIHGGDVIFRVRSPMIDYCSALVYDASTGGKLSLPRPSFLLYARLRFLSGQTPPTANPGGVQ